MYIVSELGCSCVTTYVAFANNFGTINKQVLQGIKQGHDADRI